MMTSERLARLVKEALEDAKASDIVVIDVRGKTSVTDFVIVATANSVRHARASIERITEYVKEMGEQVLGVEGKDIGEWVLVDCIDAVAHVMQDETRRFYDLEGLWLTETEAEIETQN